jgi:serine/threonine protein kinase/tetratricopeptide (TPR) repeat protein
MTERSIFLAALDRSDPADRAAYLDQACAGDSDLRRRVEDLLAAHAEPGSFLEPPAGLGDATASVGDEGSVDARAPSPITEGPGSRIGPYKLLQEIGQGGMGVVYMAEQETPVRRKVALKIIKPGMDTRQVVARFEAERQALALMDHPHIARVLDAGTTESGRPYFVMDLVRGIPITQYCDEAKLSPRERLELFIPACQAIQHAHQKGIIHRDIKPSNILVTLHDGKPVPKIIDFGVAKAIDQRLTERTLFTQFGALIGTPEYMSPEQAELSGLDVDTRSDIYSLGVLLYELLTGTTPLERAKLREAGYAEVLRRIKEEEPPRPSTRLSHAGDRLASIAATRRTEPARLTRLVRGELDWIVMKALEKERTRRYETANGLARDVQRYLGGNAVEAGPPSAAYRLRKFARKHRAALGTVTAFVILLIVASVVSTYLAIRAMRAERVATAEQNRAMVAERDAVEQRDRAVAAEREAKAAAERATTEAAIARAVNDFLQHDLLGQADVDNQAGPGQKPDPDIKVRTLLDRAAAAIDGRFVAQPVVEAAIRRSIGDAYLALGLHSSAETHLDRSIALARRELGDQHRDTLNTIANLGNMYWYQGKYAQAEQLFTEALNGLRHVQGEEHPDTIRAMVYLGWLLVDRGKISEVEPLLVTTLDLSRKVLGEDHYRTLSMMEGLAEVYRYAGKFAECERYLTKALESAQRILGEDHSLTLRVMAERARVYQVQGKYAQADEISAKALERIRRVRGAEHLMTLAIMVLRAESLNKIGKAPQAEALSTEAVEGYRRTLGEDHDYACFAKAVLAEAYQAQDRLAEAETLFAQALAGWRRTAGEDYSGNLLALNPLAELYLDEGRPENAEPLLIDAQKVGASLGDQGTLIAETAAALARLRLMQRKPAEAEPPARRALAIRLDRHPDHWTRFDALSLLGAALAGQRKYAEAERLLLSAYEGLKEREARIPFLWRKKRPAEAGARIVALYDAWGKKDQGDAWRKMLKTNSAARP